MEEAASAAHHEFTTVLSSHVVIGAVATLTLVLRFTARRRGGSLYGWDDWLCLVAGLCMWGDFVMTILEYRPYLREVDMEELSIPNQSLLKQLSFGSIFFTSACEVIARLSLIFLYYRIFSIKKWLGWTLKIIGGLSVAWLVVAIAVVIFQCKPVAAVVDASISGECMDNQLGFIFAEAVNLLLDLALVPLPVRTIWKLQLPFAERLGVAVIFLTGLAVIITQVLRMIFGYNPDTGGDRSVTSLSRLSLWTGLHLGFAIICACLPVLRVYLPADKWISNSRLGHLYNSFSGWMSSGSRKSKSPSHSGKSSLPTYQEPNILSHTDHPGPYSSNDEIPLTEHHYVKK
ncbi:unnamed protein product [Clonostachys chloroleuca]|uniref:Rhodopsin domain-containing protein n=1 Tax=Clonostachys chloroleuca TaxID=1926264 RepID=A0AA35QER5_9HYPO|nr:unnamed protein product [Clonostachys chloroleuca]